MPRYLMPIDINQNKTMDGNEVRVINFERICRLCLHERPALTDIFEAAVDARDLTIDQKILACAAVDLCRDDGLPSRICFKCLSSVNAAFEFRIQCENTDKMLHDIRNLLFTEQVEREKSQLVEENENEEKKEHINEKVQLLNFDQVIVIKKESEETIEEEAAGDLCYVINDKDLRSKIFDEEIISNEEVASNDSFDDLSLQEEEATESNETTCSTEENPSYEVVNQEQKMVSKQKQKAKEPCIVKKSPCPYCKKMLTKVNAHIKLLHRNRVYVCAKPECGAHFSTLKNLQSHQLICYNVEKAYKCSSCSKEFHRNSNYKAHMRRHSDKKEFECQLCDRAFVDSTGLKRHFLKHHEPQQETFMSGCCGKKFKSKEGLKKHIQKVVCGVKIIKILDSEQVT